MIFTTSIGKTCELAGVSKKTNSIYKRRKELKLWQKLFKAQQS